MFPLSKLPLVKFVNKIISVNVRNSIIAILSHVIMCELRTSVLFLRFSFIIPYNFIQVFRRVISIQVCKILALPYRFVCVIDDDDL